MRVSVGKASMRVGLTQGVRGARSHSRTEPKYIGDVSS